MSEALPILMYHTIDTECDAAYRRWAVPPKTFGRHLDLIAARGFRPITVSSLIAHRERAEPLPPHTVVITFDDGLRDFLVGAMPELRRHDFPATLYVVSGHVNQTSTWLAPLGEGQRPMLNWDELRAVASQGIEIGGHTHTHPQLDLLPLSKALSELRQSKTILEDNLGLPVQSFAYPHGYASPATRRLVCEAGFTSACRVRHALSSTAENCFALSRIIMTTEISDEDLEMFLDGSGLPVAPPSDRLVATGWRLIRRFKHLAGVPA